MRFIYKLLIFIAITIWVLLIFVEPLSEKFNELIYSIPFAQIMFSHVCHQNPDKLIEIGGYHTMVCSRCTGIYTGALLSSFIILILPAIKNFSTKYLVYSFIPVLVDVVLVNLGMYTYSKTSAFISGVILGSSVFYYFYKVISQQISGKN